MPKGRSGYSFQVEEFPEREKIAIAKGVNLPIKFKHAREIANAIMERGMMLKEAINYLKRVMRKEAAVPFKRYKKNVGHRKELHDWKWVAGRYPYKASYYVLKVLENALNNARNKGLNEDNLKILLIAAHKGRIIRRRPDRRGPGLLKGWKIKRGTNIEVIVIEVPEEEAITEVTPTEVEETLEELTETEEGLEEEKELEKLEEIETIDDIEKENIIEEEGE